MLLRRLPAIVLPALIPCLVLAQSGGGSTFAFLNSPSSARAASMGGTFISTSDHGLGAVADNPALLSPALSNTVALNYVRLPAAINYGGFAYASKLRDASMLSGGIRYLNYGSFTGMDYTGTPTSDFKAADYAFDISYSRKVYENITAGVTYRNIYSVMDRYVAYGMALDAGVFYVADSARLSAAFVVRNAGTELVPYVGAGREPLPLRIQLAGSMKLKKAPLRLTLMLDNLQRYDLSYRSPSDPPPETDPVTGEVIERVITADKLLRHLVIGAEFVPGDKFFLAFAYNHLQRREMALSTRSGMAGMSLGAGVMIKGFRLSYAYRGYFLGTGGNFITLSRKLPGFFHKKKASA